MLLAPSETMTCTSFSYNLLWICGFGEFKDTVRGMTGSDLDLFSSTVWSPFLIKKSSWRAEEYVTWCILWCVRSGSWFVHAVEGHRDDGVDLCPGHFCQFGGIQHQQETWSLCTRLHHDTQQHTCNANTDGVNMCVWVCFHLRHA